MSGRELAERLTMLSPELKVLYISGAEEAAGGGRLLRPGTAFLQKPFTPDDLAHSVRELLDLPAYGNPQRLEQELGSARDEIKTLKGILPICAGCKKIRDEKGLWNQVEKYIGEHSEVEFSHGMCPECIKRLYPDIWEEMQEEGQRSQA